jgi:glutamate formiminotransferase/formiminotetrahydrofolate cyclodeaminase
MRRLVECVPNFSEGQSNAVIEKITQAVESVLGVTLLHVEAGRDTNRTVITFVGNPDSTVEAAFQAMAAAQEQIDMRKHKGAHPRIGATDVCPFVPIHAVSMAECVALAEKLASRAGRELKIPIYLYGKAARIPKRRRLPDIRKGEYEALQKKIKDPAFQPDYGPAEFHATSGATAIGARNLLVAYNVNLNTEDVRLAKEIGLNVRTKGRKKRDRSGRIMKDENGIAITVPGRLEHCQATGWVIDAYRCAQVTMNLMNYEATGLHTAFEVIRDEATKLGLRVTGSEIVGMLPKKALLDAGTFYLKQKGKDVDIPEREIMNTAISSLGLNDKTQFDPQQKVIEYALDKKLP